MNKFVLPTILMILFYASNTFAQSYNFSPLQTINLAPSITINKTKIFDDHIFMTGFSRVEGGDINTCILKLDFDGNILQQKIIGEPNLFERGSDLFILNHSTIWLLVNSASLDGTDIKMLQLNNHFDIIQTIDLNIEQALFAQQLEVTSDELIISLIYQKTALQVYPVIGKHHLKNKTQSFIHLDYDTQTFFEPDDLKNTFLIDAQGKKIVDSEAVKKQIKKANITVENGFSKTLNHFQINKNGFLFCGAENTNNYSDFWAAKFDLKGNSIWEKVYEKEDDVGADILIKVIPQKDQTALFGNHYKKKDNLNYNFNYVLVDKKGDEIINKIYDTGFDENFNDALPFDNGYLLFGHVDIEPDKNKKGTNIKTVGENVIDSNLLFLEISKDGTLLHQVEHKLDGFQKAQNIFKTSSRTFLIIGKNQLNDKSSFFIQKLNIPIGSK